MKYIEKINDYSKELIYLMIILFFIINSLFYFNYQKNENIDNYMKNLIKEYQLQYETLYENFNELSQNTFYGIINKPEIYNLIKYAYKKDEETENLFREQLYARLISDYNRLVNFNFEQLHFHYPNNTSFLRMHKVNKFGDDLTNIRFGIKEVNKNLKPLNGFEIGKVEDGFRYIYPLFDEKLIHIGSAEVSVNSKFFEKKFERNYNLDSHFLLNKSIAKSKMFKESFDKYDVSYENDDYVYSENQKEEAKHFANSEFYSLNNQKIIKEKMKKSEKFIIYERVQSNYVAICFLPIKNIENINNAAYMVLYKESEFIKQVINNFYKMILIILLLAIIVIFYFSYIFKQKKENKNREIILSQQSKMAAIGEMIENISHQWRQPLSVISITASGIKLKKEFSNISDKELIDSLDSIVNRTEYLSNTIEDFRNYFNESKEKKSFKISHTFNSVISMFKKDFNSQNIILVSNIADITLVTYENELKQVIMNIFKNIKDVLKDGIVLITITQKKNILKITIQDSAGGIPNKIIKSIFDPYFTTKHKSLGVGLGLFSTYEIVNKVLKGSIYVENKEFDYNFKKYKGACFTIILNKDKLKD